MRQSIWLLRDHDSPVCEILLALQFSLMSQLFSPPFNLLAFSKHKLVRCPRQLSRVRTDLLLFVSCHSLLFFPFEVLIDCFVLEIFLNTLIMQILLSLLELWLLINQCLSFCRFRKVLFFHSILVLVNDNFLANFATSIHFSLVSNPLWVWIWRVVVFS